MLDLVKIDGNVFDVHISAIEEKAEKVQGKNSGTALYRQREIPDTVGIKYAHSITFSPKENAPESFDQLFSYLFDNVRDSVMLEAVHGQKTITYEATYNTGGRRVSYINKIQNPDTEEETEFVGWDDLTVEFRSIETVINPAGV
jgi:hypothetical protein